MRVLFICLLFIAGCSTLERFMGDDGFEENVNTEEGADFSNVAPPVTKAHWRCCATLCRGSDKVVSVATETDSPLINCVCTSSKQFRVQRIR